MNSAEVFSRILPVVGEHLFNKRIALLGSAHLLMEYLAGCGITRYTGQCATEAQRLSEKYGLQIDLTWEKPDFLVAAGNRHELAEAEKASAEWGVEGLFFTQLPNGTGLILPLPISGALSLDVGLSGTLLLDNLLSLTAAMVKGRLLQSTDCARPDIERLFNQGWLLAGHPSWPWIVKGVLPEEIESLSRDSKPEADLRGRRVLIVGLGSLGSVAAQMLARKGADLVLVDGETVEASNLARQIYGMRHIGSLKAAACAEILKAYCPQQILYCIEALNLDNLAILDSLGHFDFALLATGTVMDRAISRYLRQMGVAHTAISCYARARYFEAIVVTHDGPCFGCIRGHIYRGVSPEPTPEQRRLYVSSEHDLQAEPATIVETARAATMAAMIAQGYLEPQTATWLHRALGEGSTLFLGGNHAELNDGVYAYGIETVGEARVYGTADIAGRGEYVECWDCGRKFDIAVRYEESSILPMVTDY